MLLSSPNDCGDKEQVRMISNQVQVKVISDGGYGPFCDTYFIFTGQHFTEDQNKASSINVYCVHVAKIFI